VYIERGFSIPISLLSSLSKTLTEVN